MDNEEMTYWRHKTPIGVKVEEISGGSGRSIKVRQMLARQIYAENGRDGGYRNIEHYADGSPYLEGEDTRISLSHTDTILVVATLPATPEVTLNHYTQRAAMGIDAEKCNREVKGAVADRILSPAEKDLVATAGPQAPILAWTLKEAMYKATLGSGSDWRNDYTIIRLPDPDTGALGAGHVRMAETDEIEEFILYSYRSEEHIISLAIHPKCATYKKNSNV